MIKTKRRYRAAEVAVRGERFGIALDGRPARTPAGAELIVPTRPLAEAIAGEFRAQGAELVPESMPLTRLANAAIDRVKAGRQDIIADIAAYAESDLVCYRANEPEDLVRAQAAASDPMLQWVRERFGAELRVGAGIMPVAQDPAGVAKLKTAAASFDDMMLTALYSTIKNCGSLVLALALAEGRIDAREALGLSQTEESYQAGRWGLDPVYAARREQLARELASAARFMELCRA
ncbi:MAG: ATP12 family protein [Alphaproteobacteria bacterium]